MLLTLPLTDMLTQAGGRTTDFEDFVSHEPMRSLLDHYRLRGSNAITSTHRALQVCSWYDSVVNEAFQLAI